MCAHTVSILSSSVFCTFTYALSAPRRGRQTTKLRLKHYLTQLHEDCSVLANSVSCSFLGEAKGEWASQEILRGHPPPRELLRSAGEALVANQVLEGPSWSCPPRKLLVVLSTPETPRGPVHPGNSSWSSPPRKLLVVQCTPETPRGPVHSGNSSWSSSPRKLLVDAACDLVLGLPGIRTSTSSELGRAPYQRLQHMPWTGVGARHHTPFQLRPECPVIAASFHSRPRVRRLGARPNRDALRRAPRFGAPATMVVAVCDGGGAARARRRRGCVRSRGGFTD